jgi:membrane-associated phospholipid phosphatase
MRRPAADYRGVRLNNLTSPQYRHLLLLLGWVGYFILYTLTENLIPPERCFPVHCALDDLIPFNEYFLIAYCSWYVLIVASLLWFLLYDVEKFRQLQTYIIITQAVAMAIYILFPTRQDLRPLAFARDNLLTQLMAFIYAFDTSTGVCPSLHVAYSLGIASAWLRERDAALPLRIAIAVWCGVICISVTFVKQHSALDILAALPLGALAEYLVFLRPALRRKKERKKPQRTD